jgi:hypothetical protein
MKEQVVLGVGHGGSNPSNRSAVVVLWGHTFYNNTVPQQNLATGNWDDPSAPVFYSDRKHMVWNENWDDSLNASSFTSTVEPLEAIPAGRLLDKSPFLTTLQQVCTPPLAMAPYVCPL